MADLANLIKNSTLRDLDDVYFVEESTMYARSDEQIDKSEMPLVIVHPFYRWRRKTLSGFPLLPESVTEADRTYLNGLVSFMREFDGPLIILEQKLRVLETLQRIGSLGIRNGLRIVPTVNTGYAPESMSVESAVAYIDSFAGNNVLFAGGRIYPKNWLGLSGCLGGFVERFRENSSKKANVLERLTYK